MSANKNKIPDYKTLSFGAKTITISPTIVEIKPVLKRCFFPNFQTRTVATPSNPRNPLRDWVTIFPIIINTAAMKYASLKILFFDQRKKPR